MDIDDMDLNDLFTEVELNPPTSRELIHETGIQLGVKFPKDYVDFMVKSNGAEGNVGISIHSILVLWSLEDLVKLNDDFSVREFADGLVVFGTDGAWTAYAFDTRVEEVPIVALPFIPMDLKRVRKCSDTFIGFLEYLNRKE